MRFFDNMQRESGRSIQSKLLLGLISSTVFVLIVVGISLVFLEKADRIRNVHDQIQELNFRIIDLQEVEQQFYTFENLSDKFYQTGSDQLTENFTFVYDQLRSDLNELIQSPQISEEQRVNLTEIDSMLLQYNGLFTQLKNNVYQRGFKDFGLEGEMRESAHILEDENNSISTVDLLMLRRHEKDFFLRAEQEYVVKFNALATSIKTKLSGHTESVEDVKRLEMYQDDFNELVQIETLIGQDLHKGLRGDLSGLSHNIDERFDRFSEKSQKIVQDRIHSIENFYFVSIGISLLISIFLAFYLSSILASPLREMTRSIRKYNFDDVKDSKNIEIDTTTLEFRQLATSFNSLVRILAEQIQLVDEKGREIHAQNQLLQKSEKELKASNKVKDKFFSIISHDLKGPIGAMGVYLEALSEDVNSFSKEELKIFATRMLESVNNLTELMENLLEWSRSQTGVIQFNPVEFSLHKAINFNLRLIEDRAEKKNISVTTELPDEINVFADRNMVDFIVRNILSNAIKFTPNNGKVKISAFQNDNYVEIAIADNGIGIPKEDRTRIFKTTEHITTYGTADEKGTGLGLILCKEFVEQNRGSIWLSSEVGNGTKVTFTLPANR